MSEYGLVAWDSVEFSNKPNRNRDRDEFVRLQSGSNVVRLVTRPFQYNFHKWKADPNDKGYGNKIKCSLGKDGRCPLCDLDSSDPGHKVKRRWYVGVIDRKTQSYKILDMSPAVFQAIQKLVRNEKWGDPGNYDIDIVVDKNAGATGYYTVMPEPKEPLTDADIEIRKNRADKETLERLCTPFTYEKALSKMNELRDKAGMAHVAPSASTESAAQAPAPAQTQTTQAAQTETESDSSEDEEVFDFPPANVG